MNTIDAEIVSAAKAFVIDLLDRELPEDRLFHSQKHTLCVLRNIEVIGEQSDLTKEELDLLRVCALFHDVGYIKTIVNHEEVSAAYAKAFLELNHINNSDIKQVMDSILATKVPQKPKDKLSRILCDADLMHLTFDDYFKRIELMRKEWEKTGTAKLSDRQFHKESLDFFNSHHYHSDYGKEVLTPLKEKTKMKIIDKVYPGNQTNQDIS